MLVARKTAAAPYAALKSGLGHPIKGLSCPLGWLAWLDDLDFIENKSSIAYHDADYYGIHVSFADVINVREK